MFSRAVIYSFSRVRGIFAGGGADLELIIMTQGGSASLEGETGRSAGVGFPLCTWREIGRTRGSP